MVNVEVIVDVVVFVRRLLKRREVRPAVVVSEQRPAAEIAQDRLHAGGKLRLGLSHEERDHRRTG